MGNKYLSVYTKLTEMVIVISDDVDSQAKIIKQSKKDILYFVSLKSTKNKQLHILIYTDEFNKIHTHSRTLT